MSTVETITDPPDGLLKMPGRRLLPSLIAPPHVVNQQLTTSN